MEIQSEGRITCLQQQTSREPTDRRTTCSTGGFALHWLVQLVMACGCRPPVNSRSCFSDPGKAKLMNLAFLHRSLLLDQPWVIISQTIERQRLARSQFFHWSDIRTCWRDRHRSATCVMFSLGWNQVNERARRNYAVAAFEPKWWVRAQRMAMLVWVSLLCPVSQRLFSASDVLWHDTGKECLHKSRDDARTYCICRRSVWSSSGCLEREEEERRHATNKWERHICLGFLFFLLVDDMGLFFPAAERENKSTFLVAFSYWLPVLFTCLVLRLLSTHRRTTCRDLSALYRRSPRYFWLTRLVVLSSAVPVDQPLIIIIIIISSSRNDSMTSDKPLIICLLHCYSLRSTKRLVSSRATCPLFLPPSERMLRDIHPFKSLTSRIAENAKQTVSWSTKLAWTKVFIVRALSAVLLLLLSLLLQSTSASFRERKSSIIYGK